MGVTQTNTTSEGRSRNELLTLWLVIATLGVLYFLYSIVSGYLGLIEALSRRPEPMSEFDILLNPARSSTIFQIALLIIVSIGLWGIFRWKRWGLNILFIMGIIIFFLNIIPNGGYVRFELFRSTIIVPFFMTIVLFAAISRQSKDFR